MSVDTAHRDDLARAACDILALKDVTIRFGGLTAVRDFSLSVGRHELVGMIGPNGAGKTTIFNIVSGLYRPDAGAVRFDGQDLLRRRPHEIAQLGIARTFQNIRLFDELSVLDNVRTAYHPRARSGILAAVARSGAFRREEREIRDKAAGLLEVFQLGAGRDEPAGNLAYGDQRRLEIARALATGPRLLLLDEPAAGMNARESRRLLELIKSVRERFRLAILLIDHDMHFVMNICERIVVLDHGVEIADGKPDEIRSDPKVIEAYLGEDWARDAQAH